MKNIAEEWDRAKQIKDKLYNMALNNIKKSARPVTFVDLNLQEGGKDE